MADLDIHQGEGKPLQLTYINTLTKKATDLTGAVMAFIMRDSVDGSVVIKKDDEDFNKGLASDGIITFAIEDTETNITPGLYYAQARAHLASTNNDLTDIFEIEILPSLFSFARCLLDGKVTVTT